MMALLLNPWTWLAAIVFFTATYGGTLLKGISIGKKSALHTLEVRAAKLKAEQEPGLATSLANYIIGVQDDANLIALFDGAVDDLRVCPTAASAGVPSVQPSPADQARAAKIAAAVKSDLAAGVACHRKLSTLIDTAVVAGAAKP